MQGQVKRYCNENEALSIITNYPPSDPESQGTKLVLNLHCAFSLLSELSSQASLEACIHVTEGRKIPL